MGGSADPGTVIGKLWMLLDAFDGLHLDLSLTDLIKATGLPKGTVHRICGDLVEWGVLERSPVDHRYSIGERLFELGSLAQRPRLLRDAAQASMTDLVRGTGQIVHLAVASNGRVRYLESMAPDRHSMQVSRLAPTMPMHCTSTGKALLAWGSREQLTRVLDRPLQRATKHTVVTARALLAQLKVVRFRQFAVEEQECRLGYSSVAVPIRQGDGAVVASLALTSPTHRADIDGMFTNLRGAAERIGSDLRSLAADRIGAAEPSAYSTSTSRAVSDTTSR